MLENVGHEYMEEFFGCCESSLAEDGIFVLQVSATCTQIIIKEKTFLLETKFT